MAKEAEISELLGNGGDPISYTVSSATTIPKGSVMEMEDLRTMKMVSAADKPLAGIAAAEKSSSDATTSLSVYTNGVFKMYAGTTGCTVGHQVVSEAGGNTVKNFDTLDNETGDVLGYAMETATNGETLLIRVKK